MKTIVMAACAWALAAAAQAAAPSPEDEAALRTLAASVDEAWDLKDAGLMSGYYTVDATLLVEGPNGTRQGQALQAYFQQSFAGRASVLRHVSELQALDMVGPDAALADLQVRIEAQQPDGRWKELRRFNNLSLATREGGAWKLRAVRAHPAN